MKSVIDIDKTLRVIKEAARSMQSCRFRRGNVVVLPPKGDLVVTGDLHGDVAAFAEIARAADLGGHPGRHIILQEFIHGNDAAMCGSCVLVEEAALLVNRFPDRVHILLGNHEAAELTGRIITKGGMVLNKLFQDEADARYGPRAREAVAYMHGLWRALPLAARTPNGIFISHSTPTLRALASFDAGVLSRPITDADFARDDGAAYALLWGRDFSAEAAERLKAVFEADFFIVGHTPCPEGFAAPNGAHIILDSQGASGKYIKLPLDQALTYQGLMDKIEAIWK